MENKSLLEKIEEICRNNRDYEEFQPVIIKGNKTTIKIKKEKKDESEID